jgi:hypothetical protein
MGAKLYQGTVAFSKGASLSSISYASYFYPLFFIFSSVYLLTFSSANLLFSILFSLLLIFKVN